MEPTIHPSLKLLAIDMSNPSESKYITVDDIIGYLWGKSKINLSIIHNDEVLYTHTECGGDVTHVQQIIADKLIALSQTIPEEYAFWRYDAFPFCLGGPIVKRLPYNRVSVKGYPGREFTPIKILPFEQGVELSKLLTCLEESREAELTAVRDKYKKSIQEILPEIFK